MDKLMNSMRAMTIRMRMIGSLIVVLVLVGIVGATGMFTLAQQRAQADAFIARALAQSRLLADINRLVGDINRLAKDMVINYDKSEIVTRQHERWLVAVDGAKKTLTAVLDGSTERERPLAPDA